MNQAEPSARRPRGRPRASGDRACARCGHLGPKTTTKYRFPEGIICGSCYDAAIHTHGQCADCGDPRLLPYRNAADGAICVDCAGVDRDFHCGRCRHEGAIFRGGLCERCAIADDLDVLLGLSADAGRPELIALRTRLVEVERPASIYVWMRSDQVKTLLRGFASGDISLTHQALDALPQTGAVRHLRAILVELELLTPRDEALARFEAWVMAKLADVPDAHREPIERFATWHHLRHIRVRSAAGEHVQPATHAAKQQITVATRFLAWLGERGTTLERCTQADVDLWLTSGPTTRYSVTDFLRFTAESRLSPSLHIPKRKARTTRRLQADDRLDWVRYYLEPGRLTSSARAVALLLLVFGQPLTRIACLPLTVITETDDRVMMITLGVNPIEVPEPLAGIFREHLRDRARTATQNIAANPYLFPGLRSGSHITRMHLKHELNQAGIDVLAAKNTSLDELVGAMAGPLVADTLGYSYSAIAEHERHRGKRYETYVGARLL